MGNLKELNARWRDNRETLLQRLKPTARKYRSGRAEARPSEESRHSARLRGPNLSGGGGMRRILLRAIAVILILFFCQASILAHHGTAAYDTAKSLTLKGVVTSFEFINPHAELRVAVTDENGRTVNWLAETNNPNRLARRGWNRNVLKAGDAIT